MKSIYVFLAMFIVLSSVSLCQKFLISDIPAQYYSIDRIGQKIYFQDFYSDTIREINIKTKEIKKTSYEILPVFSNKNYIAAYALKADNNPNHYNYRIFLHYFVNDSDYLLIDSAGFLYNSDGIISFSPNDNNLFYAGHYFSFKDSMKSSLDSMKGDIGYPPEWSSDSTLIYRSNSNSILEYNLNNKKIDTLVFLGQYDYISSYAYNTKYNLLAYSKDETYPKIYLHYPGKNIDSIAFDPLRDDPKSPCWGTPVSLRSLSWSPNENRLAFFILHLTNRLAGLYEYNLDSNKTFRHTVCYDSHSKYYLRWLNNDTTIYADTYVQLLYGFDMTSAITKINSNNYQIQQNNFIISNYPNPFNLSTSISWQLGICGYVTLKVYDILGREVKTLIDKKYYNSGKHTITFNANGLSSGVYFYQIKAGSYVETKKLILLK